MAFFDDLGKSITGASQTAVQQAKDVADITRLSALLSENKSRISLINRQIGEKYYELFREAAGEEFAELVGKETELLIENANLEEQLMLLRGQQKCPSCGTIISKEATFCSHCGQKIVSQGMKECPKCGKVIREDSAFCTQCGYAFGKK